MALLTSFVTSLKRHGVDTAEDTDAAGDDGPEAARR
jgi:hypothetical protein